MTAQILYEPMRAALRRVRDHPFITGLADGTLEREAFAYYILQDTLYLRDYAKALVSVAAKAPADELPILARHAIGSTEAELASHRELLADCGVDPDIADKTQASPTTTAYLSYLLAVTSRGSYGEGIAVVLPCYWIYYEVGKVLAAASSADPVYAQWIDTYSTPEFATVVAEIEQIVGRVTQQADEQELARMSQHVEMASRYEWMFWDAALRQEHWPW